jgi:hypothetical protein
MLRSLMKPGGLQGFKFGSDIRWPLDIYVLLTNSSARELLLSSCDLINY